MAGLPTTRFYLDDGTGTFPDDITPYVRLTDGFTITRGRADTENAPTAGVLNLVVNNSTGAFTPGATVLANPTTIKVDQRIKVVETVNGTAFTRFVGYVKTWALGWLDVAETTAIVRITATDAQARAERRVMLSVVEEEYLADAPGLLYLMSDPATAITAGDSSGNQGPAMITAGSALSAAPAFGVAAPVATLGSRTVVQLNGGRHLYLYPGITPPGGATAVWYEIGFTTTSVGSDMLIDDNASLAQMQLNGGGKLQNNTTGGSTPSGTVNDGLPHHALVKTIAGGAREFWVDGALVESSAGPFSLPAALNAIAVGARPFLDTTTFPFNGKVFDFAIGFTNISAGQIADHANAIRNGFAGESGVSRITRLAGYAGLSVGSLDASLTNVPFVDLTDQTVWQAIQDVCDAEMGVAYIAGDGTTTFHNRQRVTSKSAPDLSVTALGWGIRPDAEPTTDDTGLVNFLEVASAVTGVTQLARSTSSEATHGRYSDSKSYLVSTDAEALDRGNWIVATQAEPAAAGRYPALVINMYGLTPAQQAQVLTATDQGSWLRVANMPSQTTGGTTVDEVIEGYTETQNAEEWSITCNVVSKAALYPVVWVLGVAALGVDTRLGV